MRILIATEDAAARLLISATAARAGHDCVQAIDGIEAWRLCREYAPDTVIADPRMPGLDEPELVTRIRAYAGATTQVLLLIDPSDQHPTPHALADNAANVLATPLNPHEIERKLDAAQHVIDPRRANSPRDPSPSRPTRLMIADDDPVIRTILAAVIDHEPTLELVGEAEDAEQAITLAFSCRPEIVLLDVDMPKGGGLRVATELRQHQPATRVIALSADDTTDAQLEMRRAGAAGYIVKGASPDAILRTIHDATCR